jgi:hypothetical protein
MAPSAINTSGTLSTSGASGISGVAESAITEPVTQAQAAPEASSATAAAPSTTDAQTPASTELAQWLEVMEPILLNPLVGAGVLLALMVVVAWLVYRRNRREDVPERSSFHRTDEDLEEPSAPPVLMDPLLQPRGLQAEIMALDLELGPSAPSSTVVAPVRQKPAPPTGADLRLSKLQWAQQLLAAGENELARVLLTSVAESLHSQLQQRGDATPGPHQ